MELNPNPDPTDDTNNDAGENEAARLSLFPGIDPKILNRKIETAYGRHCKDDHFQTREHTVWALLKDLTVVYDASGAARFGFTQGYKDGPCILQGALVEGTGARTAKNVTRNHLLLVDYDTGHSVDEIEAAITKLGLFALLWTTHSHMKCETLVPEDALVKYAGSFDAVTVEVARAYLAGVKKYKPEIAASVTACERDQAEGGMKFRIAHAPMPRVRAMFVLAAPFDFAKRGGTQTEAITEWTERYTGLCTSLGLPSDKSCLDPSRLMYTPRIPKGADERNYEFRIVPGSMLDLETVERISDKPDRKSKQKRAGGKASGAWLTPGLVDWFAAGHAAEFEAARFMEENDPDGVRHDYGGDKLDFCCPNEDNHTTPTPDDRAFVVENASARESGFWMHCQHAGCKAASKGDRAWYLDKACQKYGIKHADELLAWCPNFKAEEKERGDERTTLLEEIAADDFAAKYPDADARRPLMKRIAAAWPEHTDRKMRARDIARALDSLELRHALLKEIEEAGAKADNAAQEEINPATYDGPILSVWSAKTRLDVAVSQLQRKNDDDPSLFQGADSNVRASGGPGDIKLVPVSTFAHWSNVLTHTLTFDEGEHVDSTLLADVQGEVGFDFPKCSQVIGCPVFAKDGSLKIERGYHAELEAYHDPQIKFLPVPDVVTAEQLEIASAWIEEAIRDFPFSDCFGGDETLPIYLETKDADGYRLPNKERGRSSRAHWYCTFLNPFVVHIIDDVTPLYHIEKHKPDTGASYLASVGIITMMGDSTLQTGDHQDDAELEKRTLTNMKEGAPINFMDNLNNRIASGSYAATVTGRNISGRLLGGNTNLKVRNKFTWITAGNNVDYSSEIVRRICPMLLDAGEDKPRVREARGDIKHMMPGWVLDHRAELVWSAHVLVRYALQRGLLEKADTYKGPRMSSFGRWSCIMGTLLGLIDVPGFLENVEAYIGDKDEDRDEDKETLRALWDAVGKEEFTVKDGYKATRAELGSLAELASGDDVKAEHKGVTRFGFRLKRIKGVQRFTDGAGRVRVVRLVKCREKNPTRYKIVEVE